MMKTMLVCAVAMTSLFGCSSSDGGSGGTTLDCNAVCAKQAALMCPNDVPSSNCVSSCQSEIQLAAKFPQCSSQWDAYASCLSTAHAVCDMFGHSMVQGCDAENLALVKCSNGDSDGGPGR